MMIFNKAFYPRPQMETDLREEAGMEIDIQEDDEDDDNNDREETQW